MTSEDRVVIVLFSNSPFDGESAQEFDLLRKDEPPTVFERNAMLQLEIARQGKRDVLENVPKELVKLDHRLTIKLLTALHHDVVEKPVATYFDMWPCSVFRVPERWQNLGGRTNPRRQVAHSALNFGKAGR